MSKYRVKLGKHVVDGLLRSQGNEFECKSEVLDKGEGARFFERVLPAPAPAAGDAPAVEGGKKGKPDPKPKAGAAGEAAAAPAAAPAEASGDAPAAV